MANQKKQSEPDRLLTEVELELMTVIWSLSKATVKEVAASVAKTRQLAYTTVATVMKVLEQKKFLKCEKDSYAHVFYPVVSKASYEGACIDHMVSHVFDGEPAALVQRLLSDRKLTREDTLAIEKTLKILAAEASK